MPMLIEHIDAIARQKQRDVLFLEFNTPGPQGPFEEIAREDQGCNWRALPSRLKIIGWLDEQKIAWKPCGAFANLNFMTSYRGQIYIDLPFEPSSAEFKSLEAFLEFPDGQYPCRRQVSRQQPLCLSCRPHLQSAVTNHSQ